MFSIWFGIFLVRISTKKAAKQEDSATSSDEIMEISHSGAFYKKSDGDKSSTHIANESVNRIFGASKASFR